MFQIRIIFFRIRIRIQRLRLETNTVNKNWKKITAEKKTNIFFGSKTAIYLSLGLHKVCPSCRRSLQLSKEVIQHFLPSWIQIRIPNPDPDPLARLNTDPIRIRIRNPVFNLRGFTKNVFYKPMNRNITSIRKFNLPKTGLLFSSRSRLSVASLCSGATSSWTVRWLHPLLAKQRRLNNSSHHVKNIKSCKFFGDDTKKEISHYSQNLTGTASRDE